MDEILMQLQQCNDKDVLLKVVLLIILISASSIIPFWNQPILSHQGFAHRASQHGQTDSDGNLDC